MRTVTVLLVVVMAGCSVTKPRPARSIVSGVLEAVFFEEEAAVVYDAAFTLAFSRGYQINYASQEEAMIEVDLPTQAGLLGTDWVHRVAVLVRTQDGRSVVYTRYHSYDPEKGTLRAVEADRWVAEAFLEALSQRLTPVVRS